MFEQSFLIPLLLTVTLFLLSGDTPISPTSPPTPMALTEIVATRHPRQTQRFKTSSDEPKPSTPATYHPPSKSTIKAATRTRLTFSLLTSFLFLISLVFTILVEVGNTSADHRHITGSIYFIKLDLSHIIPQAVPQAQLINSIARTIGLHDFYQVGLWNYCEGYRDEISGCSTPKTLYWFNPVEIILSELLAGATSTSPLLAEPLPPLHSILPRSHLLISTPQQSPFPPMSSRLSTSSASPPTGCSPSFSSAPA